LDEESRQGLVRQEPEPSNEAAEVVAGGYENGVGNVAVMELKIVAAHAVFGLEIADDGFDGGSATLRALDLGCHPSLLSRDEDA
jgi:hypothetical protein